jgi:hypothetical protein
MTSLATCQTFMTPSTPKVSDVLQPKQRPVSIIPSQSPVIEEVPALTKRQTKPPKKLEDYVTVLTAGEKDLENDTCLQSV